MRPNHDVGLVEEFHLLAEGELAQLDALEAVTLEQRGDLRFVKHAADGGVAARDENAPGLLVFFPAGHILRRSVAGSPQRYRRAGKSCSGRRRRGAQMSFSGWIQVSYGRYSEREVFRQQELHAFPQRRAQEIGHEEGDLGRRLGLREHG